MLTDKEIEIISDVTVRYIAHDSYKNLSGAIARLKKRLEKYSLSECEEIFQLSMKVYNESAELIKSRKFINFSENRISELSDIDFQKNFEFLIQRNENTDTRLISILLNWTIFWYYLK
jgi:hypothetical protein